VLLKQLNTVSDLVAHSVQSEHFIRTNPNAHLLPPHSQAKLSRSEMENFAVFERKKLEAEQALEREEETQLSSWRVGRCPGRVAPEEASAAAQGGEFFVCYLSCRYLVAACFNLVAISL
jgi:hypothetical protein